MQSHRDHLDERNLTDLISIHEELGDMFMGRALEAMQYG
jgi:hypothetical protein